MQITNKHEIAILFILYLGVETKTILTLSAEIGVSTSYLEKITRIHRQEGLIASVMGPGSGYYLTRTVQDITIKDILLVGGKQGSGLIFNTIIYQMGDLPVNSLMNEPSQKSSMGYCA
ncbi:Rrf2 family transcriptional regulator [Klebsiella huaxiensis]|uniref:HTH-type transcriptional regulator IscR n=1 Tax=Klebsiella huaxiensis TaxID=2153354 RepID=A0A564KTE3_9ENTR|nr:Rrf2 family transcriptional regulator [Klebsiella huaxiensis]VUS72547.1 HTH-type transcriptional regulator IscR [Klebsiella huaxiensis]